MASDTETEGSGRQTPGTATTRPAAGAARVGVHLPRPRNWVYHFAIGFLAGVLVAVLVLPGGDNQDTVGVRSGSGDPSEVSGTEDITGLDSVEGIGGVEGVPGGDQPGVAGTGAGGRTAGRGTGGATPGAAGATGSGPTGNTGPAVGAPVATARKGVTNDKIRIGVIVPSDNPRTGSIYDAYAAEVDRWRREGLLPVHGRDVELVKHEWTLIAESDGPPQRAACVDLAQDKKVFAVMAWIVAPSAADCLATEFDTPVIMSITGFSDDLLRRAWPYLFATEMSADRVLRNWSQWAHENGLLKDRTIGLYYSNDATFKARIDKNFKPVLAELGYSIKLEQARGPEGSNAVAVQRFQAAGVNTIFLMTSGTAAEGQGEFSRTAEAQGYRPQYLVSDFEFSSNTADTAPTSYGWVPEQFGNVFAMTFWRRGETGAPGQEATPAAGNACIDNLFRVTGKRYNRADTSESGTWDATQATCDQARAMIKALHQAGPGLSELALVRALETAVKNQPSGAVADITFSSTKHDGADQLKGNRGNAGCFCWKLLHGFRPASRP